jgi:hypothetical protein
MQRRTVGVYDWLPVGGSYPTSCWAPGEMIIDQTSIPLSSPPSGDVWISIALFDFDTREYLTATTPEMDADTQVGLGPIPLR